MAAVNPTPYNSYGQILGMGGERTAASLLTQGLTLSEVLTRLNAKFGPATTETLTAVAQFAQGMIDAAGVLQDTPIGEEYDLSAIPINPNLWGSNPERGRGFIFGELSTLEGQQPRYFRYDFAANVTPLDLFTQFSIELPSWVEMYPGKFNEYAQSEGDNFQWLLLYTERMF